MSAPLAKQDRSPGQPTALELANQRSEPWHDAEWQRLWLAVAPRQWRSLALIPAGDGASLDFTLVIAMTLSRTGMVHLGQPLQVADATQVPLNQLSAFSSEIQRCTENGQRLLVALPPTGNSAITTTIAQSVDAAVLCILSEKMSSQEAKRTVHAVGAARFLGSALFHPHQLSKR